MFCNTLPPKIHGIASLAAYNFNLFFEKDSSGPLFRGPRLVYHSTSYALLDAYGNLLRTLIRYRKGTAPWRLH